ncbi:hypothetical protein L3Q82_001270 [Scortum barcoo]|uniref:Uncharacterized protein n=1 Tax=Scortum barcoo TaxID=214431 RepID=A0ACB8W8U0_9TELE|nr:hypothetical protein L3Q82_001270 [Scortum barcoo]
MPPGRLPREVFQACPIREEAPGRPRTRWRDYVSRLAWETPRDPPEELEEVSGHLHTPNVGRGEHAESGTPSAANSSQEGPGFNPWLKAGPSVWSLHVFSLCLRGFSLGTPASSPTIQRHAVRQIQAKPVFVSGPKCRRQSRRQIKVNRLTVTLDFEKMDRSQEAWRQVRNLKDFAQRDHFQNDCYHCTFRAANQTCKCEIGDSAKDISLPISRDLNHLEALAEKCIQHHPAQAAGDKLQLAGVDHHLTTWILDYLTHRPQFVRVQGFESDRLLCSTGAPQGTVLAPFLFTLYTADFFVQYSILSSPEVL